MKKGIGIMFNAKCTFLCNMSGIKKSPVGVLSPLSCFQEKQNAGRFFCALPFLEDCFASKTGAFKRLLWFVPKILCENSIFIGFCVFNDKFINRKGI